MARLLRPWHLAYMRLHSKFTHRHCARTRLTGLLCRLKDLKWQAPHLHVMCGLILAAVSFSWISPNPSCKLKSGSASLNPKNPYLEEGLGNGGDLTVSAKHLRKLGFSDARALLALIQGST